jgi:hypothetical protein
MPFVERTSEERPMPYARAVNIAPGSEGSFEGYAEEL